MAAYHEQFPVAPSYPAQFAADTGAAKSPPSAPAEAAPAKAGPMDYVRQYLRGPGMPTAGGMVLGTMLSRFGPYGRMAGAYGGGFALEGLRQRLSELSGNQEPRTVGDILAGENRAGKQQAALQGVGDLAAFGAAKTMIPAFKAVFAPEAAQTPWLAEEAARQGVKVGAEGTTAAADPLVATRNAEQLATTVAVNPQKAARQVLALGKQAAEARSTASMASGKVVAAAGNEGRVFSATEAASGALAHESAKLGRPLTEAEQAAIVGQMRDRINEVLGEPFGVGSPPMPKASGLLDAEGKALPAPPPKMTYTPTELDRARKVLDAGEAATYNKAARGVVSAAAASPVDLIAARSIRDLLHTEVPGLKAARGTESQAIKVAQAAKTGSPKALSTLAEGGDATAQRIAVAQAIRDGNMKRLEWYAAKGDPEAKAGVIGWAARKGDRAKLFDLAEAGDPVAKTLAIEHAIANEDESTLRWFAAKGDQRAKDALLARASGRAEAGGPVRIPWVPPAIQSLIPAELRSAGMVTRTGLMAAHPVTGMALSQAPRLAALPLTTPPSPDAAQQIRQQMKAASKRGDLALTAKLEQQLRALEAQP